MDYHGNQPSELSQDIQCVDCGHRYRIAAGQQSSRCAVCGNIGFHSSAGAVAPVVPKAVGNVVPISAPHRPKTVLSDDPRLESFRQPADGLRVQDYLFDYQVEWQLWAKLVSDFGNSSLHAAYLSHTISHRGFDVASERYSLHRSVMAATQDGRWQAEISDLMLERIQMVSVVGMEQNNARSLPAWLWALPSDSRVMRIGWIALGLGLMARLFGVV